MTCGAQGASIHSQIAFQDSRNHRLSISVMAMLRQLMRPPAGAENTTFTIGITYAHLELPGLTEAVEKQDWETAKQQAEILRQALVNNNRLIVELKSSLSPEK
jgi:hypothetical protein